VVGLALLYLPWVVVFWAHVDAGPSGKENVPLILGGWVAYQAAIYVLVALLARGMSSAKAWLITAFGGLVGFIPITILVGLSDSLITSLFSGHHK
jgi:hypothetical protein